MISELVAGAEIIIDGHKFRITSIVSGQVHLIDLITKAELTYKKRDIETLIFKDEAKFSYDDPKLRQITATTSGDFSIQSDENKNKARERLEYIEAVLDSGIRGLTQKNLDPLIEKVSSRLDGKRPSWRTLKRWYDLFSQYGNAGLIPNYGKRGNRKSRVSTKLDELIDKSLDELKRKEKISFIEAYKNFKDSVVLTNRELQGSEMLKPISYVSYLARARKLNAYEVAVGQYGKKVANKLYRENKENRVKRSVKYILDRAEIDHTKLDLFIFDHSTGLPLGRPWITSVLDMKSKSVLGVYVGFEPPSFVSVGRAIKSAISDKSELLSSYENVKNEWLCRGVFHVIAVDRGKEFMSQLLEEALFELSIAIDRNPVLKPWYKGSIESHFNSVNRSLLSSLPGKVFSTLVDKREYDPAKNGCISFKAFLNILYLWIVDYYQVNKNSSYNVPNLIWRQDESSVDTRPISNQKLELVFAENKTPKNSDKGIRINHIQYDNRELRNLRVRGGFEKVKVKYNREDINFIWVWDSQNESYFEVHSLNPAYTRGLSLFQHQTILKYHRKFVDENIDTEALVDTRQEIKKIVLEELSNRKRQKKSATMAKASRYGNVSSHAGGEKSLHESMQNFAKTTDNIATIDTKKLEQDLLKPIDDDDIDEFDFS